MVKGKNATDRYCCCMPERQGEKTDHIMLTSLKIKPTLYIYKVVNL